MVHHMQLRERKNRHLNCGTAGKKVPECKRLRCGIVSFLVVLFYVHILIIMVVLLCARFFQCYMLHTKIQNEELSLLNNYMYVCM